VRYGWDLWGGEMSLKGDASYSSSYFYNLRNFDADKFGSYVLLNLGMGWKSAGDRFEIGLAVDNVTNKRIGIQGFDLATLCGCNEVSYKLPRTFYLKTRVNF
jgi:iron complex outermembrane receptor protein